MKISARNQIKGTIKFIQEGAVNAEVGIQSADGTLIISVVTKETVSYLGLKVGSPAYAIVKASNVMIGID